MTVSRLILLQFLTIAAGYDFKDRRIPKALIYLYFLFGLFLHEAPEALLSFPLRLLRYILLYFLLLVMLLFLASLTHAGGGDARLMALIGAWCGIEEGSRILLPGLLLALSWQLLIRTAYFQKMTAKPPTLPLAVPLLLGAIPGLILSPV